MAVLRFIFLMMLLCTIGLFAESEVYDIPEVKRFIQEMKFLVDSASFYKKDDRYSKRRQSRSMQTRAESMALFRDQLAFPLNKVMGDYFRSDEAIRDALIKRGFVQAEENNTFSIRSDGSFYDYYGVIITQKGRLLGSQLFSTFTYDRESFLSLFLTLESLENAQLLFPKSLNNFIMGFCNLSKDGYERLFHSPNYYHWYFLTAENSPFYDFQRPAITDNDIDTLIAQVKGSVTGSLIDLMEKARANHFMYVGMEISNFLQVCKFNIHEFSQKEKDLMRQLINIVLYKTHNCETAHNPLVGKTQCEKEILISFFGSNPQFLMDFNMYFKDIFNDLLYDFDILREDIADVFLDEKIQREMNSIDNRRVKFFSQQMLE
eukprot:COSAG01_NODE_61_length_29729_cov_196.711779_12_plen_376_part_00